MANNKKTKFSPLFPNKPLAFLDNAATSQKPACVINAISNYYTNSNSNVHRGIYELAEDAENLYHQARKSIAQRFNVSVNQVIFVRGATEGLNLIAQSFGSLVLKQGDCMILTEMEHHANIVPWQQLCTQSQLKVAHIKENGELVICTTSFSDEKSIFAAFEKYYPKSYQKIYTEEVPFSKRLNQNIDILDRESFYKKDKINYWKFSIFSLSNT